jgi:ADP-ribose pyrophosphatase YjhB (NUDIX family)
MRFLGAVWRHVPGLVRRRMVRTGQARFTVTVGVLIFDEANRILLLDHVFRADSNWGIPGGFVAGSEQAEAALRREMREEIGIEIEDVVLLFTRTLVRPRQIEIYFRARPIGDPTPSSFEIKSAKWFALDDLPSELSRDQRRLIERVTGTSENSHQ